MLFQPPLQLGSTMFGVKADVEFGLGTRRNDIGCRVADIDRCDIRCRGGEMRVAPVKFRTVHRCQHLHQPCHRIVGQMGIGDMPLCPCHNQMAAQTAPPPVLDHVTQHVGIGGFAHDAHVRDLVIGHGPFDHSYRTIQRITFFITGDQQADRPGHAAANYHRRRSHKGSHTAFHIGCTASK